MSHVVALLGWRADMLRLNLEEEEWERRGVCDLEKYGILFFKDVRHCLPKKWYWRTSLVPFLRTCFSFFVAFFLFCLSTNAGSAERRFKKHKTAVCTCSVAGGPSRLTQRSSYLHRKKNRLKKPEKKIMANLLIFLAALLAIPSSGSVSSSAKNRVSQL